MHGGEMYPASEAALLEQLMRTFEQRLKWRFLHSLPRQLCRHTGLRTVEFVSVSISDDRVWYSCTCGKASKSSKTLN
jgi:hypothetical protein